MRYLLFLPLVLAAGCLSVPDPEAPMCKVTADCDSGEICDEGVCWGNPPMGPFAAVVSPPSERTGELVSREFLTLPISSDGWMDDLRLETAVTYKGRLQTLCEPPTICDDRMLGATITIARPSQFHGGPAFKKVVTVEPGDDTFEINVPATQPNDPPYTLTVVPEGRADAPGSTVSIAQLVPPLRTELRLPASASNNIIELGGLTLKTITGRITTNNAAGLGMYRVVALGRWTPDEPQSEVSTVDYTGDTGDFKLTLSKGLVEFVEIVAKPYGGSLRPTLHLGAIPADKDATNKILALPTALPGPPVTVNIVAKHQESGGTITSVIGARVLITSTVPTANNSTATLQIEGITDETGVAQLKVLDIPTYAQAYKLSIIPPPGSKAAAQFAKPYSVSPEDVRQLGTRVAIRGVVYDKNNEPVKDVSVTAQPSVRFLWSLEAAPQAFLGSIPPSTTVTPDTGEFAVFVDSSFDNISGATPTTIWGHYDLVFEPTVKSKRPSWIQSDIELPRDAETDVVTLPVVEVPDAAYVRGYVFDADGAQLEGAEVKLFRVEHNLTLCTETRFEPQSCPIPALLMGRGAADDAGVVRLTLPR